MSSSRRESIPSPTALRGDEVIARRVQRTLRPEDDYKFIAVDVNTEEFEIDSSDYAAVSRLRNRLPDATIWLARVGQPAAYRIGRG